MGSEPASPSPTPTGVVGEANGDRGDPSAVLPTWDPPRAPVSGPAQLNDERVRLALRVVVRLDRLGPPGPDGTARPEATQVGLAEAIGVTQGAVSKVLSRLAAVNIVAQERRHVPGRDRRVRVYYLSREGTELARDIEQRFGLAPPRAGQV